MRKIRKLWLLVLCASSAVAEVIHWSGQAPGNWNVATNWNPVQIPAAEDEVYIPVDLRGTVPDGYAAEVRNLTLSGADSDL